MGDGGRLVSEGVDLVRELASVRVGAVEQVCGEEEDEEWGGDCCGEALDVPTGEDGSEAREDAEDGGCGEDGRVVVKVGEAAQRWPEELCGVAERSAREPARGVCMERGSQHLDPPGLDVHRGHRSRGVDGGESVNSLSTRLELCGRPV